MSYYRVNVTAGRKHAAVNLTVIAKDRKSAVRMAEENVRQTYGLKPSATVLGTVAA